jgi:beta-phosphoglucomutase-like phosphatase (HAD superfamily)
MKTFEDRGDGGMSITDRQDQIQIHLASDEAYALWRWLSARKDTFQARARKEQLGLEIHLYEGDLSHLDELKAIIPNLQERGPIVKVLGAPRETVSERALQLLKNFQIEYHIHPMLEGDDVYAQG